MSESNHPYWGRQFDNFVNEFSRLCIACDIDILEKGIAERILSNDETVCRRRNPEAFKKVRRAIMAFYEVEEKAIERLGPAEVQVMLDQMRIAIAKTRGVELDISRPAGPSNDQNGA